MKAMDEKSVALPRPKAAVTCILLVYAVSFFLPVGGVRGYVLFLYGPFYLCAGFPWLANPFLWFGVWRLWRCDEENALTLGCTATLLAAGWFVVPQNIRESPGMEPGFWLWFASCVLLVVLTLWRLSNSPPNKSPAHDRRMNSPDDTVTSITADPHVRD